MCPGLCVIANGGFACGARPNTPLGWYEGLEGCCLGSGLHALHLIWNHALVERAGTVFINLPISRSSHTVEVDASHAVTVSRPDDVARLIDEAARATAA